MKTDVCIRTLFFFFPTLNNNLITCRIYLVTLTPCLQRKHCMCRTWHGPAYVSTQAGFGSIQSGCQHFGSLYTLQYTITVVMHVNAGKQTSSLKKRYSTSDIKVKAV